MSRWSRWTEDGWRGWIDPEAALDVRACLAAARQGGGRASRHARTVATPTAGGTVFVKTYPAPGGRRARCAFRMGRALAAGGFGAPSALLYATRAGEGLLVTRDAEGEDLAAAVAGLGASGATRLAKRALLAALGAEVARLHAAGFVHGDLVPPNVRVRDGAFVFLDHDRTRRSHLLVWLAARRNLVQLGRFVVPGLSVADRLRVLAAYAARRGLSRRARRRLAQWLVMKITARRCAIDRIPPATAAAVGFRRLMRSGGPFDPTAAAGRMAEAL